MAHNIENWSEAGGIEANTRKSFCPVKTGLLPIRPGYSSSSFFKSPQGRTLRKSGLTPIKPEKSPRGALFPIRPGFSSISSYKSPQGTTPRKSGLTPIRPEKSPGGALKCRVGLFSNQPTGALGSSNSLFGQELRFKSGLLPVKHGENGNNSIVGSANCLSGKSPNPKPKFKSGLTPIRPAKSPCQSKTPRGGNSNTSKFKSGLLPIRPTNIQSDGLMETSMSFASRRKSGLIPIRPNLKKDSGDASFSVQLPSTVNNQVSATNSNNSDHNPPPGNVTRKSFVVPSMKYNPGGKLKPNSNSKRSNVPIRNFRPSNQSRQQLNPSTSKNGQKTVDPKSLNTISEETESPRKSKNHNLSGIQPLDETADTPFKLRSQSKRTISIPLRLNFSDVEDEADEASSISNILKDSTSKLNSLVLKVPTAAVESTTKGAVEKNPRSSPKDSYTVDDLPQLRSRRLEKQAELHYLDRLIEKLESAAHPQAGMPSHEFDDMDSPFANVDSPFLVEPADLLAPEDTKRPEDIYKIARKSCSFLKTPKPSAFRKENFPALGGPEDTPNIGVRLAQQLASLYSDS